jgi:hypothetical protein
MNWQNLPQDFRPHDISRISMRLADLKDREKKGEFETTEEYNKRLEANRRSPILGNLTLADVYAIEVEHLSKTYDADKRILKVRSPAISLGINLRAKKQDLRSFTVMSNLVGRSTYTGSNAFGVSKEIEKTEYANYDLEFDDAAFFPLYGGSVSDFGKGEHYVYYAKFGTDIPMEAEEAMKSKGNIRALFVCKFISPYINISESHTTPTIDSPKDVTVTTSKLSIDLLEVWFYNKVNGNVYAKLRPSTKITEPIIEK